MLVRGATVLLLAASASAAGAPPSVRPMHNGGTPGGIPPKTDCNLREFMWEAGKKLMPRRGTFKTLFDSMQLETCGVEGPAELDVWKPPAGAKALAGSIYVDATKGSDTAAGSLAAPLKTIGAAMKKATAALAEADAGEATIVLRAGVYHGCDGQGNVCALGAAQSGLTITNFAAEDVTVTGGEPLAIAAADWKKLPMPSTGGTKWTEMPNMNDVADRAGNPTPGSDTKCCKFLGELDSLKSCEAAAEKVGGGFVSSHPKASIACDSWACSDRWRVIRGSVLRDCFCNRQGSPTTPLGSRNRRTRSTATVSTPATGSSRSLSRALIQRTTPRTKALPPRSTSPISINSRGASRQSSTGCVWGNSVPVSSTQHTPPAAAL